MLSLLLCLPRGDHRIAYVVATAVLALHPMPKTEHPDDYCVKAVRESWFAVALYKYFSYRFAWFGGNFDACTHAGQRSWIGAGPPHGVLPIANLLSMPACNTVAGRGFVGAAASVVKHTPWLRYMCVFGIIDVSGRAMAKACEDDTLDVGMVPDGIAGIFQQNEADEVVYLKHRKGLAKLCLKRGIDIVPAYSLGNTAAYDCWFDKRTGVLEALSRKSQTSLFLYWGRFWLPIPRRTNITMLFGAPIKVEKMDAEKITQADIDAVHSKLLGAIELLFDEHKSALGWGHRKIRFI